MRKLALISALLLASLSAHAGESRGLVLAASDASSTSDIAAPLPPIKKSQEVKAVVKQEVRQAPRQQAAVSARPLSPKSGTGRYGAEEAKARRIAAKYGVYW
jgi:hypothetical protein